MEVLPDEEIINVAHFHKTLCTSRNHYDVRLSGYPRWREDVQSVASLNSSISSIRIRQPVNPRTSKKILSSFSTGNLNNTKNRYKNKKSQRSRLRNEHIKNRQSPHLRWIVEDNDFNSYHEDEYEEKQRLRRLKLKKKRRRRRKKRWKHQRQYLIKLAAEQNVNNRSYITQNNVHNNNNNRNNDVLITDMKLDDLWENQMNSRSRKKESQSFDNSIHMADTFFKKSPILNVRTEARIDLIRHHNNKKNRETKNRNRKIINKNKMRMKLKKKVSLDEKELLLKRREKLRETFAAFKAMTAAVEKAHAIVKDVSLDNNKRTKQSVTLKKDANKKDLLHDLEQQQQRLTLEMQRMTRLLNDSKLKVYGEEGEEVYLNMRVA